MRGGGLALQKKKSFFKAREKKSTNFVATKLETKKKTFFCGFPKLHHFNFRGIYCAFGSIPTLPIIGVEFFLLTITDVTLIEIITQ